MATESYTLKTGGLSTQTSKEHQHSQLIETIYDFLNEELLELFTAMLDSADRTLADYMKATDPDNPPDEKKELEIRAIRLLCDQRANINTNFFIALNELLSPSFSSAFDEDEELRLVDTDEMEEMVAITTMHANALNLFGVDVNHLVARIEYLEILSAPIFDSQALSPNHICEVFQTAIKPFDFTTANKLILFRYFDEHVNLKLANLYQSINTMLIAADILPEVILSSKNDEPVEEKSFESRTVSYYDPSENKANDFIPRSQSEMNNIVNLFMRGDISITGDELELPASFYKDPKDQGNSGKNLYARKDVIHSLNRLQDRLLELGAQSELINHKEIKSSLMKEMGVVSDDPAAKEIAVLDERSIDFVGMMFDAITSDESISPVISELVMQLQIPVIKVAVSDEALFTNEHHPARDVLNLIPQAGKGVTEEQDRIYADLENIVNDILNEYEIDTACFEQAVETLNKLIATEENLAKTQEREQQRTIIRDHARSVVISELRNLTAKRSIPKEVQPLLLKNWSTLMMNRYIKHGKGSYQWLESILLLKLMMKCLQPIQQKSQWEFLNSNHSALVEAVNDELYDTRQDKEEINEKLSALKNKFVQMLDEFGYRLDEAETVQTAEYAESDKAFDIDIEHELDAARQEAQIALDKISRLPENVKPGVWFEVFNGEDRAIRRLKMSTILTEAAKIIFVDRKGVKVLEKDAGDFLEELSHNQSRVLADHSTFDHALGKVISAMAA